MKELQEKFFKYKNTYVLYCLDVVKLLDIEEDDLDMYYVFQTLKQGKIYSSVLLDFIPLIDTLSFDDYDKVSGMFEMNLMEIKEDEKSVKDDVEFLKRQVENIWKEIYKL